jgi:spore photoproduct lyase
MSDKVEISIPTKVLEALPSGWWDAMEEREQTLMVDFAEVGRFTFQQLRTSATALIDSRMWEEPALFLDTEKRWTSLLQEAATQGSRFNRPQATQVFFRWLQESHAELARRPKRYGGEKKEDISRLPKHKVEGKELKGRLLRLCPAASPKMVCCNLKTLQVADNCAMACSYCVLQNHYDEPVIALPTNLREKLKEVQLDPDKRYRIGTGEYSDSLLWGNQNGLLEDLCEFATNHPNAVLELKTKSARVAWFLENPAPANVCCSWSLNPQIVIDHEEHKTASLEQRLKAARSVADRGVKVAFHLHPMMFFEGWEEAYRHLIGLLIERFRPEEVLWVSLGTVTLLKGFAQDFRSKYQHSKLLQMEFETTPEGKLTYPRPVREALYKNAREALEPWRAKVFQYLCMEHAPLWNAVMGYDYPNMKAFDDVFNENVFAKLDQ